MIDRKNFLEQPVNNDIRTYDNLKKTATCQGNGYTTRCLIDYIYFKGYCEMKAVDVSKHEVLDADQKAIQQFSFTRNVDRTGNTTFFLLLNKQKKSFAVFHKDLCKYCELILLCYKTNIKWLNIIL